MVPTKTLARRSDSRARIQKWLPCMVLMSAMTAYAGYLHADDSLLERARNMFGGEPEQTLPTVWYKPIPSLRSTSIEEARKGQTGLSKPKLVALPELPNAPVTVDVVHASADEPEPQSSENHPAATQAPLMEQPTTKSESADSKEPGLLEVAASAVAELFSKDASVETANTEENETAEEASSESDVVTAAVEEPEDGPALVMPPVDTQMTFTEPEIKETTEEERQSTKLEAERERERVMTAMRRALTSPHPVPNEQAHKRFSLRKNPKTPKMVVSASSGSAISTESQTQSSATEVDSPVMVETKQVEQAVNTPVVPKERKTTADHQVTAPPKKQDVVAKERFVPEHTPKPRSRRVMKSTVIAGKPDPKPAREMPEVARAEKTEPTETPAVAKVTMPPADAEKIETSIPVAVSQKQPAVILPAQHVEDETKDDATTNSAMVELPEKIEVKQTKPVPPAEKPAPPAVVDQRVYASRPKAFSGVRAGGLFGGWKSVPRVPFVPHVKATPVVSTVEEEPVVVTTNTTQENTNDTVVAVTETADAPTKTDETPAEPSSVPEPVMAPAEVVVAPVEKEIVPVAATEAVTKTEQPTAEPIDVDTQKEPEVVATTQPAPVVPPMEETPTAVQPATSETQPAVAAVIPEETKTPETTAPEMPLPVAAESVAAAESVDVAESETKTPENVLPPELMPAADAEPTSPIVASDKEEEQTPVVETKDTEVAENESTSPVMNAPPVPATEPASEIAPETVVTTAADEKLSAFKLPTIEAPAEMTTVEPAPEPVAPQPPSFDGPLDAIPAVAATPVSDDVKESEAIPQAGSARVSDAAVAPFGQQTRPMDPASLPTPNQRVAYNHAAAGHCCDTLLNSKIDVDRERALQTLAAMAGWERHPVALQAVNKVLLGDYQTRMRRVAVQMLASLRQPPASIVETLRLSARFDEDAEIREFAKMAVLQLSSLPTQPIR